jgi:tetratricopeptide (TPR) repeat protein
VSHAPNDAIGDPTSSTHVAFRKAVQRRSELIRDGMSNSGNERNCCFLNTGTGRFANISAAAGLDHIGDGRAYALVDWDQDGDLDVWATNRTGPRVQFLRNNSSSENQFLVIKLQGNGITTNRDAIGARVELMLHNPQSEIGNPKLIKTVKAGEGFLGQSSKSLHFGMGPESRIDRLIVHWPGADTEEFTDLEVNRHYAIEQGSGTGRPWSRPTDEVMLAPLSSEPQEASEQARIPLRYRIPMPSLQYETLDGRTEVLGDDSQSATLVNLWASWCQPCLKELVDFRKHGEQLRAEGLNIVALSVDKLAEDKASNPQAARAFLDRHGFSFEVGFATNELIGKLEAAFYYLFDFRRPWAVPTSLLLDRKGRLSVIYIGAVDVGQLSSDIGQLSLSDEAWFDASLPFEGRWTDEARHPNLVALIRTFLDRGFVDDGLRFVDKYADALVAHPESSALLVRLGASLRDEGHVVKAKQRFQQAIRANPQNANAHLQFGKLLAQQRQFEDAARHCRESLRLLPGNADAHFFLANLLNSQGDKDGALVHFQRTVELRPNLSKARFSLGNAYAGKLQWEKAVEQFRVATDVDPDKTDAHYQLAHALQKSGQLQDAILHYQHTIQLAPEFAEAQYSLGAAFTKTGKYDQAIKHFRLALDLKPDSIVILNGLAWTLATSGLSSDEGNAQAVRLAEQAARKTKYEHPQILDTLAAAYAADGQFDKAVSTAEKAITLATESGSQQMVSELQQRLKLYRQRQPYREGEE